MFVILVSFAFGFGMLLARFGLPPMVGFLVAGFAYNLLGLERPAGLEVAADLGITLLLFSIGLKLDVRGLLKPVIWASATAQMVLTTGVIFGALLAAQALTGSALLAVSWPTLVLLGFALSFSSTVFAVKALEEKGDMSAFYGVVAIGILIMQDLFAVLYLAISEGKIPSPWAVAVLALPLARPVLFWLMDRAGRGELFILCGLFFALGLGAEGFNLVKLKPDLGALAVGVLVAGHPRASELSKALFGFKELMLVGFFLSVGMKGLPNAGMVGAAALLCLLLPLKTGIYHLVVSRFGLRPRTSLFTALALTNYSEFGLILTAIAAKQGALSPDWLLVVAIAVSLSFFVGAPLCTRSEAVYRFMHRWLCHFECTRCHPNEAPIDLGAAKAVILGMGRIGMGAYDELRPVYGDDILGVEHVPARVDRNREAGRNVILGDACDTEFWLKLQNDKQLEMVILAMPNHTGNMFAAHQLHNMGFSGQVAAVARFPEEVEELDGLGVCAVFNMYERAGTGLARFSLDACQLRERA
ncbi:cation:proton antiporter domain-containing protein [Solidesulfovibrio sp.]